MIIVLIMLTWAAFVVYCLLCMEGIVRSPIDFKYTANVEYFGDADPNTTFYSHQYNITVTDNETGESTTVPCYRFPDIYGNEKSWARQQARKIYKSMVSSSGSFTL